MRWLDEVAGLVAGTVIILGIAFWVVMGTVPQAQAASCWETRVSWYGRETCQGRPPGRGKGKCQTASGVPFDGSQWLIAHRSLPFHTKLRVTYNGSSVTAPVEDRGPFHRDKHGNYDRGADLSYAVAKALGLIHAGVGTVRVCRL
jgi:rare lipoprotein A